MTKTVSEQRPHLASFALWLAILVLTFAGAAHATTYRQLSLAEMLDATQLAVVATVASLSVESRDGLPWTVVEFDVERSLAGTPGETLRLAFLGGDPPGAAALQVNLMPEFTVGERVLLLAYDANYYSPIIGFNQGLWRLDASGAVDELGRRLGLDDQGRLVADGELGAVEPVIEAMVRELEAR